MSIIVDDISEIGQYPGTKLEDILSFPIGSFVVKAEATKPTEIDAITDAKSLVKDYAIRKVASTCGRFPYVQLKDPIPANAPKTITTTSNHVGTNWEAKTQDVVLNLMNYNAGIDRFALHKFCPGGNVIVYEMAQIPIAPNAEQKQLSGKPYSKIIKGRAVAPNEAQARTDAVRNAYTQLRDYALQQHGSFMMVIDKPLLAGMLELYKTSDVGADKKVSLEKVYNVHGFTHKSAMYKHFES